MSLKLISAAITVTVVGACANNSALEVSRALFGYIEPPKAESVMESLKAEYRRCMAVDPNRPCVQLAYDNVRVSQGLDPKAVPEGYVRIVKGELEKDTTDNETDQKNQ